LAPKVKSLAAWEMRRGRIPVVEAQARIGRMTEGERRRGRQAVREEKEEYDRAVERFCARHGRGGIEEGMEGGRGRGAREEEGEVGQEERGRELREEEEEEGGVGGEDEEEEDDEDEDEDDDDVPLGVLLSSTRGRRHR